MENASEVARLRKELDEICISMWSGFSGFATVGKHSFVNKRYAKLGEVQEQLQEHVGKEQAFQEILDALDRSEKGKPS